MKKKVLAAVLCALGILWMVGCSANSDAPTTEQGDVPVDTENQGQTAEQTTDLSAVVELIGKADEDTADLLGGGEENWTSDQQTFIGRIYQTELYGDPVMVYSSCSAEKTVDAVSVWISDGEQEVTDEMLQTWQERISSFTGAEMQDKGTAVESGSQAWSWQANHMIYSLRLLDNILTLDINPAVGETN